MYRILFLPYKFPFQKVPNLLRPINIFQEDHGDFFFPEVLALEPHVEEALGEEAVDAGFVGVVGANVDAAFQGEEDVEEPGGVFVEEAFFHDEHVEDMEGAAAHDSLEGVAVAGVFLGDDLLDFIQVFFVVGVLVLAPHGLDVVAPFPGKDDVVFGEEGFVVFPVKDGGFLFLDVFGADVFSEVAAVVAEADVVGGQVLPGPVEAGEFAVVGVFAGNVVAGVVGGVGEGFFPFGAYVEGHVYVFRRHPVFFVGGDEDGDVHGGSFREVSVLGASGLVVGSRWSVVGTRLALETVSMSPLVQGIIRPSATNFCEEGLDERRLAKYSIICYNEIKQVNSRRIRLGSRMGVGDCQEFLCPWGWLIFLFRPEGAE